MDAFVIDSNVIFSGLIKDSSVRKIILSDNFDLFVPEFSFTEIKKYEEFILKKSGLEKESLEILLLLMQSHIAVVPLKNFIDFLVEAEKEMADIDIKDAPFLALALKLKIPIWSNDIHFKRQRRIETFNTAEIMSNFLNIS